MSDALKHECGIAHIRLLKPLEYYKKKYGTAFYGINKMYLLMEKQHNRGQDGAGFASIKFDVEPGERYISRVRSIKQQPIQDVFSQINNRINKALENNPSLKEDVSLQKKHIPYVGEVMLGHVRYGTFGKNSVESVHPFLRQNNWKHRNLILAGNFNMTNVKDLFNNLIKLGQHPKEYTDTITIMEKIGHFLDAQVRKIYKDLKKEGYTKAECSPLITERLKVGKILKKSSKDWDGGYVIGGMIGHGDSFVLRDPAGIRPAFYYKDEEVIVVASERPAIQTAFKLKLEDIKEVPPGNALIINKAGDLNIKEIIKPTVRKSCSFERIYFSRGSDADIYKERKELGKLIMPTILKEINYDINNSVFSYIPNTAETSFYGMVESVDNYLINKKTKEILNNKNISKEKIIEVLSERARIEKIAIKDVKLRTFITEESSRDDLVEHVYDITYGVIKKTDTLIIIDDSIVRGTTLKKSILKMLDRLGPKKIIVVSSAPQIRYPDCYGIDMANLEGLIAFKALLSLLKDTNQYSLIEKTYKRCKSQEGLLDSKLTNYVKELYSLFSADEISNKITKLLSSDVVNSEVKIIFQSIENLHLACPEHLGDWYFTGNYPTNGGNRVVNNAFINFFEGNNRRAY
ncbi:MAG: amidophosphoribosyltransferase [Flavobacteriales bacterium]|tara:strand:+ start:38532 stop:40427 length:1896 start_codon:yes stop_codon:yes gene_type:complete